MWSPTRRRIWSRFAGSGDYTDDTRPRQKRRPASGGKASTAPLWVVVLALLISLGALGWWSYQKIAMLEMQLVATQESFARISEDAAGRLQDISGKVVATESNVTTESEAVKLRIKQLEQQAIDLARQQQAFATEQQSRPAGKAIRISAWKSRASAWSGWGPTCRASRAPPHRWPRRSRPSVASRPR